MPIRRSGAGSLAGGCSPPARSQCGQLSLPRTGASKAAAFRRILALDNNRPTVPQSGQDDFGADLGPHRIPAQQLRRKRLTDRKLLIGLAITALGVLVALAGAFVVHGAEAPDVNELGERIYDWVPRGWQTATGGQLVSVGGVLLAIAGLTYGLVYDRPLTWARATIGATLFVSVMLILFGIVPNQWLTLTQSTLEWTPQKTFIVLPSGLVLNNEVSISYAALKDMIAGGYAAVILIGTAVVMVMWQDHQKRAKEPKPQPISEYGRPMRVEN